MAQDDLESRLDVIAERLRRENEAKAAEAAAAKQKREAAEARQVEAQNWWTATGAPLLDAALARFNAKLEGTDLDLRRAILKSSPHRPTGTKPRTAEVVKTRLAFSDELPSDMFGLRFTMGEDGKIAWAIGASPATGNRGAFSLQEATEDKFLEPMILYLEQETGPG